MHMHRQTKQQYKKASKAQNSEVIHHYAGGNASPAELQDAKKTGKREVLYANDI